MNKDWDEFIEFLERNRQKALDGGLLDAEGKFVRASSLSTDKKSGKNSSSREE